MSIESNKQLTRELVDAHKRKDVQRVREILSPKLVWHDGSADKPKGRDDYITGLESGARAFSDMRLTIEQSLAERDLVAHRMRVEMRHTGEFAGIAATNRELRFMSSWIYRVVDNRVVEAWVVDEDFLGKLRAPA